MLVENRFAQVGTHPLSAPEDWHTLTYFYSSTTKELEAYVDFALLGRLRVELPPVFEVGFALHSGPGGQSLDARVKDLQVYVR